MSSPARIILSYDFDDVGGQPASRSGQFDGRSACWPVGAAMPAPRPPGASGPLEKEPFGGQPEACPAGRDPSAGHRGRLSLEDGAGRCGGRGAVQADGCAALAGVAEPIAPGSDPDTTGGA